MSHSRQYLIETATIASLLDAAQLEAMALVKKFRLTIGANHGWGCRIDDERGLKSGAFHHDDLNRAICECVYKMVTAPKP